MKALILTVARGQGFKTQGLSPFLCVLYNAGADANDPTLDCLRQSEYSKVGPLGLGLEAQLHGVLVALVAPYDSHMWNDHAVKDTFFFADPIWERCAHMSGLCVRFGLLALMTFAIRLAIQISALAWRRWESRPVSHRDVVPWRSSLIECTLPLVGRQCRRPIP